MRQSRAPHNRYRLQQYAFSVSDNQNLAGHARESRDPQGQFWLTAALVTSATVFFTQAEKTTTLLGRTDYGNAAAEVKVVVVERSVKNTRHSATDGQQQHGQCATAQTINVIVA